MHANIARDGADAAANEGGRDVDFPALEPFGTSHIICITPDPVDVHDLRVPRQLAGHQNLSSKVVECERASEGLVVGKCRDDVGLVALRDSCEIEAELS